MTKAIEPARVLFIFDDREEFIRCLEEVSRYEGLTCEVAPFRAIIMSDLLAKVCRKRGIMPTHVITTARPEGLPDEAREDNLDRIQGHIRQMLREAGHIPDAR